MADPCVFQGFPTHDRAQPPVLEAGRKCDRKALLEAVPGMLPVSAYAQEIPGWIHTDPRGWRSRAGAGAEPAPRTQHPHLSAALPSLPTPSSPLFQEHPVREAAPGSGAGLAPAGRAGFGSLAVAAPRGVFSSQRTQRKLLLRSLRAHSAFPNTWTCPGGSGLEQGQNRTKICCSWSKTQDLSVYRGITRA